MPEPQHVDPVAQFARQLNHLVAALDPQEGWYAILLRSEGDAITAHLAGRTVPPWDLVSSLLDDLQLKRGLTDSARERAREQHRTAVRAHDRRAGRPALHDALKHALAERDTADARSRGLYQPAAEGGAQQSAVDLFQTRDRHERAIARCLELQSRLSVFDADHSPGPPPQSATPRTGAVQPTAPRGPLPRRRGVGIASATLAALAFGAPAHAPVPVPDDDPTPPAPAEEEAETAAEARRLAVVTAAQLAELRAAGAGGQAYILLCEAAARPCGDSVALIGELHDTGQTEEIPTFLWEAACLPPRQLAELAAALHDAGRTEDVRSLLHNAASRPADDVAAVTRALLAADRIVQVDALLQPLMKAHRHHQAVLVAQADASLVPAILHSARRASEQDHRDMVRALRSAGVG
ncbi:hypothetical protein [Streptomyces sp. CB03911]|uniref:hypothetical protein n=1 Tax=Streptomyces sp. CB03911 TaxID=1804758 RepID=UPI00093BC78B|nr:hypothetical protein [Streptomyces sp. CB03911]OKI25607.1 hypothetical protein A6A07_30530 [Streptomyces sp. CB03911]